MYCSSIFSFFTSVFISVQDTVVNSVELKPLLEPEAVRLSFETPGWYILGAVVLLALIFVTIKWISFYKQNAYRREALKNLALIESRFQQQNDKACVNDALVLLKMVAIQAFGRPKVAQLYGEEWLVFLEKKGKDTPFQNYSSSILSMAYNQKLSDINEIKSIFSLTQKWIKTHA